MNHTIGSLVRQSVDFHCHGVGAFDFTEIPELHLQSIEDILADRGHSCILTLYMPRKHFESFLNLMEVFHRGKSQGKFSHIAGFGLEGPLLESYGGTPGAAVWLPDATQWKDLAACGKLGLVYAIMSPDAPIPGPLTIPAISEILLTGNVLPAPGHFLKSDPIGSARALQKMLDVVADWGQGATITDHLFNDMPLNFKHSWRTPKDKLVRDEQIQQINFKEWRLDNLDEQLGPVPATLIRSARKGVTKICQNFDGEHVDLEVVRQAIKLVGVENMMMMTDCVESKRLGGQDLKMQEGSTLLYQHEGIVAAGSQNVYKQVCNMVSIGLSFDEIETITHQVPNQILSQNKEEALCLS